LRISATGLPFRGCAAGRGPSDSLLPELVSNDSEPQRDQRQEDDPRQEGSGIGDRLARGGAGKSLTAPSESDDEAQGRERRAQPCSDPETHPKSGTAHRGSTYRSAKRSSSSPGPGQAAAPPRHGACRWPADVVASIRAGSYTRPACQLRLQAPQDGPELRTQDGDDSRGTALRMICGLEWRGSPPSWPSRP
jgi:hypothetical protein